MIGRNSPCWCGSGKKWKKCHFPAKGENFHNSPENIRKAFLKKYDIILKNSAQIEGIRKSCALAVEILNETCKRAKKGVTTLELNDFAHKLHLEAGALPAPLNYGTPPFPKSICTSVNEVICHGIPDKYVLREGDILNIDITCILNGFYGDCSKMVVIGKTDRERQSVVDVAYECLIRSSEILRPGIFLNEIGHIIETYATSKGCSVVDQFVGHGVGIKFHEGPQVPHFENRLKIPLLPGMIFTIEPMINAGVKEAVIDGNDRWTSRTKDGKPSAQWEYTILINESGHEILTPWTRD